MSESPSIERSAFSCPHCNAFAHQAWYNAFGASLNSFGALPKLEDALTMQEALDSHAEHGSEMNPAALTLLRSLARGEVVRDKMGIADRAHMGYRFNNCNLSECSRCGKVAVWVYDQLVHPAKVFEVEPNADMPESVKEPFDEARLIVAQSPRGAAALLRLSIQHLCKELGESGTNINNDIAALVAKGLNPLIKNSLDIVRVVGNEAVHPGSVDMKDNRKVAEQLFTLVNLVCEQMITVPNSVKDLYESLPEGKRKGIEERDKKKPIVAKPS